MTEVLGIGTSSCGRDWSTHRWTLWGDQHKSYHLQATCSPYPQTTCGRLCSNHGWVWDEPPHGRRPISTTGYGSTVTFLFLCNSYTIQSLTFDLPGYCHLFTHHCFCFQSGPAEDQISNPYLQLGRAHTCRCNATVGIGSAGFSSGQGPRCTGDGHSITYNIYMPPSMPLHLATASSVPVSTP